MSAIGTPYLDRPRLLTATGVFAATLAAWVAIGLLHPAASGADWFAALCRAAALPAGAAWPGLVAMWVLMSVAMMLPTAAPAIDIYVRLSRRIPAARAAHVAGFAGGFVLAWSALALIAGGLQAVASAPLAAWATTLPPNWPAGVILILAGTYQLTPVKQACLTLCRNPMTFFMSQWKEGIDGAVRMGFHHGAICIGCCWAMMGLMLIGGAMNLAWMAALGLMMLAEKTVPGAARAGRLIGCAMATAGAALIVTDSL